MMWELKYIQIRTVALSAPYSLPQHQAPSLTIALWIVGPVEETGHRSAQVRESVLSEYRVGVHCDLGKELVEEAE